LFLFSFFFFFFLFFFFFCVFCLCSFLCVRFGRSKCVAIGDWKFLYLFLCSAEEAFFLNIGRRQVLPPLPNPRDLADAFGFRAGPDRYFFLFFFLLFLRGGALCLPLGTRAGDPCLCAIATPPCCTLSPSKSIPAWGHPPLHGKGEKGRFPLRLHGTHEPRHSPPFLFNFIHSAGP